jgi:Na+-transporting methylmalonyl-CoA/oxaloacetate decarboxylase gamma subunit
MRIAICLRFLFIASLIALAMFGCSKKVVNTSDVKHEASTEASKVTEAKVTEKEKEIIPATDIKITQPNPCDSNGKLKVIYVEVGNGNNKAILDTRDGKLNTRCKCDSSIKALEREIYLRDSAYSKRDTIYQKAVEYKEVTRKYIPLWCWVVMGSLAALSVIAIYAFFKTLIIKFR